MRWMDTGSVVRQLEALGNVSLWCCGSRGHHDSRKFKDWGPWASWFIITPAWWYFANDNISTLFHVFFFWGGGGRAAQKYKISVVVMKFVLKYRLEFVKALGFGFDEFLHAWSGSETCQLIWSFCLWGSQDNLSWMQGVQHVVWSSWTLNSAVTFKGIWIVFAHGSLQWHVTADVPKCNDRWYVY